MGFEGVAHVIDNLKKKEALTLKIKRIKMFIKTLPV
jgi:hypothetical protein